MDGVWLSSHTVYEVRSTYSVMAEPNLVVFIALMTFILYYITSSFDCPLRNEINSVGAI